MNSVLLVKVVLFIYSCQAGMIPTSRRARLSLSEPMPYYYYKNIDGNLGTYSYGYDISDPSTGNVQYKTEERYPNGSVVGSYGYMDAWGHPQRYRYIADERGYRVMSDPPKKTYNLRPTANPPTLISDNRIPEESSMTWSRPRKPINKNRSKPFYSLLNNNMKSKHRQNYFLRPPSFYAPNEE